MDIPTLARHPRAIVPEKREVRDRAGRLLRTITENRTIWVEPGAGLNTNMALAFEHAMSVVNNWIMHPPELISPDMGLQNPRNECFPPIVINVTDGYFNIGGNPRRVAEALSHQRTNNGNVLIFNCHFTTENKKPCIFPINEAEVAGIDPYGRAKDMFYMSSSIPEPLRERAAKTMLRPIEEGARCVIYNADLDNLVRFLRWGTVGITPSTGVA